MDVLFFNYFFELFVSIPFDVADHFLGQLSVGTTAVDVEPTHRLTSSLDNALDRFEIITSATFCDSQTCRFVDTKILDKDEWVRS